MATGNKDGHVAKALRAWSEGLSSRINRFTKEVETTKKNLEHFQLELDRLKNEKAEIDTFVEQLTEPADGSGG